MRNRNKYNIIFETTTIIENSDIEIIYEGKTASGSPKVAFKSRLQEANMKNANNRRYSTRTCEAIVEHLAPRARANTLLSEIDHPLFFEGSGDPNQLKKRASIVEVKNCAAKIKSLDFKNSQVLGELETLSGFRGPDLANLLVKDKVNIGFSLRALGAVEQLQDGTLDVKTPIMPVTYDIVSNPSHKNSRVLEFIPENDTSILENANSLLFEGEELSLLEGDQVTICEGNCCVTRFLDDVINEHIMEILSKGLRFSI